MEALPSAIFRDAARDTAAATDFQVNLRASIFVGICATCAAACCPERGLGGLW
jgi:hypothetical protein